MHKTVQNVIKICYSKRQCVSASGGQGSAPGPRWGTSVPQTPSLVQF